MNAGQVLAVTLMLAAPSCEHMIRQPRYDYAEPSSLFASGTSLQVPPEGTVARDDPLRRAALLDRPRLDAALLARGRERFGIYCAVCHDASGHGRGVVPSRGFPQPPSLHEPRLRLAPSSYFVDVITNGHGVMYSYADRVTPADRWAIAAYIRALQVSQGARAAELPPVDRARLEAIP